MERGLEELCVWCVFSQCYDLLVNEDFHIHSQVSVVGEHTGLKEACLSIPVTYSLYTHSPTLQTLLRLCLCVCRCVLTVLLPVCLAAQSSVRCVRHREAVEDFIKRGETMQQLKRG